MAELISIGDNTLINLDTVMRVERDPGSKLVIITYVDGSERKYSADQRAERIWKIFESKVTAPSD